MWQPALAGSCLVSCQAGCCSCSCLQVPATDTPDTCRLLSPASGGLYTRVGAVFVPGRVAAQVLGAHLSPAHVERLLQLCCKGAAVTAPDAWQVRIACSNQNMVNSMN
jgi:hypothetical protein